MTYTVVLLQPVPEPDRPALEARLRESFRLSEEQAAKLAQRRAGRLMKPSSRERAERLLGIYRELGLAVRLEAVDDAAAAPAMTAAVTVVRPEAPARPEAPLSSEATAPSPQPAPSSQPAPSPQPAGPTLAAAPEPAPPAAEKTADQKTVAPQAAPPAGTPPAQGEAGGWEDFSAAPAKPAAASGWEDFSSALSAPERPRAEAPERAAARSRDLTIVPETAPAAPAPAAKRGAAPAVAESTQPRFPLARRLLLTALLPPLLAGLTFLVATSVLVPPAITGTAREGARATATGVGATVQADNLARAYSQMEEIVQQPAVDFISYVGRDGRELLVVDPEGLPQTPDAFSTVYDLRANEVRAALEGREQEAFGIEFGAGLRRELDEQLRLLGQSLDANDPLMLELRQARRELPAARNVEVVQLRVFEVQGADGSPQRVVVSPSEAANVQGQEIAQVAVGLVAEESRRLLRNLQLVLWVLLLLTLGLIAYFTTRLVRRIVEPLERLATAADAISMGELDNPVVAERNDEIGDLARSLERMRLSLQAAMNRLRRRR